MRELDEADYQKLKQAPSIRAGLAGIETRRQAATRRFRIILLIGAVLLAGQFYYFYTIDAVIAGVAILIIGGIATFVAASWGLWKVNEALKTGILTEAARIAGLRYVLKPDGHPVMTEAHAFLFSTAGTPRISDLFEGEIDDGRKVGFFEMGLSHTTGDDDNEKTVTDFGGQMFAFSRAEPGDGVVAVRPRDPSVGALHSMKVSVDRPGLKVSTGLVELGDDPPFDSAFEILASDPAHAKAVLGPELRRLLLEMRAAERVWFYCGPKCVLIGLWGEDRFEGGSVFRKGPIEDRIRAMVDDLNASVRTAQRLGAVVG